MKRLYTISRESINRHTVKVTAATADEALTQAKAMQLDAFTIDIEDASPSYGILTVENLPAEKEEGKPDHIRVYEAMQLSCQKCDNWEEGSAPWGCFTPHTDEDGEDYYTCNQCGTSCIQESEIREFRDWE